MSSRSTFSHSQHPSRSNCEADVSSSSNQFTRKETTRTIMANDSSHSFDTHLAPWSEYFSKMFLLGKTASTMAHDLNNILTSVLGYIELVTLTTSALPDTQRQLQHTLAAANRGKELIKQFQVLASKDNEDEQIPLLPITLNVLVTEALTILHPTIPSSIKIRQINNCTTGMLLGDSLQILRLLSNILTNAIKAMAPQKTGLVTIQLDELEAEDFKASSGKLSQSIRLTIRDTGPGIHPAIHKHLFRPFCTTSNNGTGMGLGLTIVNEIVKDHHGYITVDSESGTGCTFRIYFPQYHQTKEDDVSPDLGVITQH